VEPAPEQDRFRLDPCPPNRQPIISASSEAWGQLVRGLMAESALFEGGRAAGGWLNVRPVPGTRTAGRLGKERLSIFGRLAWVCSSTQQPGGLARAVTALAGRQACPLRCLAAVGGARFYFVEEDDLIAPFAHLIVTLPTSYSRTARRSDHW